MDVIRAYVATEHQRRDVVAARRDRERELRHELTAAREQTRAAVATNHPGVRSGFLIVDDEWAVRLRIVQSQRALTAAALCHALEQVQDAEVRARMADVAALELDDGGADPAADPVAAWWWCVLQRAHQNAVRCNLCTSVVERSTIRPRDAPLRAHAAVAAAAARMRVAASALRAWTDETTARLGALGSVAPTEQLADALGATGAMSARVRVGLSNGQSRFYHMSFCESVRRPVVTAAHLRRADTSADIAAHVGALHDACGQGGDVRGHAERLVQQARTVGAVTTRGVSMRLSKPTL